MRAAVYVRVSTNKDEQLSSLENQKSLFMNYIEEQGWDLHEVYSDIQTGTTGKRKNFQRMLEDAKEKKFDIILAKELSRLSRNQKVAMELRELVQQYGLKMHTLDGASNNFEECTNLYGLYAWIYEQESQRISVRVKTALKSRAKRGLYKGSNAPYGYTKEEGKLQIAEDETPDIVRKIFKRYLEGFGFDAIARELYESGVPSPSQVCNKKNQSSLWHGSSVRKILENPHYTGDLVQHRTSTISVTQKNRVNIAPEEYIKVENTHESIISKEEFELVQKLIESRRRRVEDKNIVSRPHTNVHLFTDLIFCADCGHGFHFKKNRKGYICGSYNKHGKKCCSPHHVLEEALEAVITHDLKKLSFALGDEVKYSVIKERVRKQKAKVESELKTYSRKIQQIEEFKSRALDMYINKEITKADYNLAIANRDKELLELEENKKICEKSLNGNMDENVIAKIKKSVDEAIGFETLTREVVNRFVEKIIIKKDGTIKIYYRFSGSKKVLNELILQN